MPKAGNRPPVGKIKAAGDHSLVYTGVLTQVLLTSGCEPSSNPPMDVG